jgi:hypothetical protein
MFDIDDVLAESATSGSVMYTLLLPVIVAPAVGGSPVTVPLTNVVSGRATAELDVVCPPSTDVVTASAMAIVVIRMRIHLRRRTFPSSPERIGPV